MFYLSLRKQPTLRNANSGISKWYLRNERNNHLSKIKRPYLWYALHRLKIDGIKAMPRDFSGANNW